MVGIGTTPPTVVSQAVSRRHTRHAPMTRTVRLLPIRPDDGLTGYIVAAPAAMTPSSATLVCHCVVLLTGSFSEPEALGAPAAEFSLDGAHVRRVALRPVGRLAPVTPLTASEPDSGVRALRPVQSGRAYRITSLPTRGLVTPALAEALEAVFARFAEQHGFTRERPLTIGLSRGFMAGSHGHGEGRAADLATVGGKGLLDWKREWDQAVAAAARLPDPPRRPEVIAAEQKGNLGYGLYKALQEHGGWRVNPAGWRPYRGVMQLFGPWTAAEGPWKPMQIKDPSPYQRKRLADQHWIFEAHGDHIHVAR